MSLFRILKATAIGVAAVAGLAALSAAAFERISRERDAHRFPAPGVAVNVNGQSVQLDCRGSGSPTVVFESGLDAFGPVSWTSVHDSIAKTTRACGYSRPGMTWSRPGTTKFDADSNAATLHAALVAAGERGPWLLVGHSIGGPYATIFASRYAGEMAGLVLVDPSHPDQFARFQEITGRTLMPSSSQVRLGERLAWTGLVRMVGASNMPATWPRSVADFAQGALSVSMGALAAETEAVPATLSRMAESRTLGDLPLIVLGAGKPMSAEERQQAKVSAEEAEAMLAARAALLGDMASWSTRGKLQIVAGSGHYIQFERPDAVIAAVREVMGYVIAHDADARGR